jgi:hypothetical protein
MTVLEAYEQAIKDFAKGDRSQETISRLRLKDEWVTARLIINEKYGFDITTEMRDILFILREGLIK